ncbi:MAG: NADH:ubiquinone oxidoreductase [Rhodobacterales bacterium]|nr:NADH:ubiquinone oxidoreductase [Rhodobacterales bacterium]
MCRNICWIIGIIAGVIAFWVAKLPVSFIAALLLGIAVAAFVGLVLSSLFCKSATAAQTMTPESARDLEADNAAALEKAKSDAAKAEADALAVAQLKADLDAKAAKEAKDAEAAKAAADKAATISAAKPVAKTKIAAKADPESGDDAAAETRKPEGLSAARGGKADDLKQIKGIGPKLEILCNEMGFYHYDQIASWGTDEVAYMNENLKGFKGRVSRDTWVEQAALLASGEATEFSKRVEKGNVYNK